MDNSDTLDSLSLASTPTAYSTQKLVQVIMSEEKEGMTRDIGSDGGDSDIEDFNPTINIIKPPKVGGIIKGVVWTGGPRTKKNKKPASPYAYRPVGFSAETKLYKRCTEPLGDKYNGSKNQSYPLKIFGEELKKRLTIQGMDSVFYLQDKDGVERNIIEYHSYFTI